jgi:Sulfotransferase family
VAPVPDRRCVIVAGLPRSGTSWAAKGLSFARGFTYYREPDNYHFVPGAEERFGTLYLTAGHDDLAYRRHMTRAAAGEIATARTLRQNPGPLLAPFGGPGRALGERFPALFLRKRHVLLKLVYANLNLAWLSANLPHARQVCLVRHPCGIFESWQRLGWEPDPAELLENERIVADHLAPFADLMRSARGFWERAGALWAATALVLHRQTPSQGERMVVAYEWLCADPVARFEELYRRLDLGWSRRAERFIRESDSEEDQRTYSMNRPTARQTDKWKARLSPEDIAACRRFVEPFGLPYYPGFEPYVSSMAGDQAAAPEARATA